ncbi:polysaccharide pyruvyl transferase WcaK-like protein [Winogradskyella wandonensis]|uniref:Polysaccharide pyruvyl transferase WcaK-like protein n=1 Tax=Winogradskyella wandonensis TaxID=1442586 RepID=A0A4R1KUE1_9FLAO|nr:polysaccharide pyruvyl transferase family protein [Winogradskyella wandonensis]TCK68812.1 polysaccharide pyruvyl transferase WcaK-like protein [Winogradskyella wandonensis]
MKNTVKKYLKRIYRHFFRKPKSKKEQKSIILPKILNESSKKSLNKIVHISAFSYGNAGDTLLPLALQNTWDTVLPTIDWNNKQIYPKVNNSLVNEINNSKGVVIGGGGLFLKDTNANKISGWQLPCSIEMLNNIKVPIVLSAVGYNRFRGQDDFEPYFKENITAFAEKSVYLGLRNTGSIEALKNYIPEQFHHKIRFQPCMTTFISELYPKITDYNNKEDFVAINTAFDRSHFRFGENIGDILSATAKVLKEISQKFPLKFYSHMPSDEAFLPFLQSYEVDYELIKLNKVHPKNIILEYAKPKLVIGMRGHAQMIPFGCKTPIVSIVSHNKLQWFLDDIGRPEWGVDVLSDAYEKDLRERVFSALANTENEMAYISSKQKELFATSINNVNDALLKMQLN